MELLESNGKIELLDLPSELIPQYALSLNLGQIFNLCSVNKQFNELICANEHFWKMKFIHDYGFEPKYSGSWLKLYQNYNSLWTFGSNESGQLGLGDRQERSAPTRLSLKVKGISAGESHTVLIDLDDNVWSFGSNYRGQLGVGERQRVLALTPMQIPQPGTPSLPFKAKAISAGGTHTVLIDLEDNVWSFGYNDDGQLGLGDQQDRLTPTLIPGPGSSTGSREPSGARLPFKAKAISAGGKHTLLIDLDDNVWSFGSNGYGRLGLGDRRRMLTPTLIPQPGNQTLPFKARAVSAGMYHTLLIDLDDNVWSFGHNDDGQLGLGSQVNRSTPTQIPQPGNSRLPFKAKAVSAGGSHTVLIDLDDNVWSFGLNGSGQLGLVDRQSRLTPTFIPRLKAKAVSAGRHHTVLIDLDDNVWSFGYNDDGQLGLGDQLNRSTPTQISYRESPTHTQLSFKAKAVSAGGIHTVLIATLITS